MPPKRRWQILDIRQPATHQEEYLNDIAETLIQIRGILKEIEQLLAEDTQ